jgi:S-adenosylmethionine:tRNA ribosyltransferase-isomerase
MRTEDFDYFLPKELIAQEPPGERDSCRLLVMDRATGALEHRIFSDLAALLRPGDLLVLNDTRVVPARLRCRRPSGGRVELLFVEPVDSLSWKVFAKPGRRLLPGATLLVEKHETLEELLVTGVASTGERVVRLAPSSRFGTIAELIEACGEIPLPPYIRRTVRTEDAEAYQTVYARNKGAVAAPTAGLHFSRSMLDALGEQGVGRAFLTLHVGPGTFLPVKVADPADHPMHAEEYLLPSETADAVVRTKREGGRVIAVGTTVVRALEHCAATCGGVRASSGRTRLKILPPYAFGVVDGLITNFHLPQSTLIMLVAAFAGREAVLNAYAGAVADRYRFFSYGDAMFIR